MFDARQSSMRDLTAYAPIRVALTGIWRVVFGLLVMVMGAAASWAAWGGDAKPTNPGDMPEWWWYVVGAGLGLIGLALASGGVGRVISAFARGCCLRAGADGMAVRLPKMGWFGRFKIEEHAFKWEEIEQIFPQTRRLNMIPVARELHIRLYGGKEVTIERFYFQASVKRVLSELQSIWAPAGK
jgi:hypothetical protein